jgi:translocation and assembly module TamB
MSRRARILKIGILSLLGLIFMVGVASILIVQTDWFRNYVRQKIITATETGTGGRVEIESFSFSPRRLEAVVKNFVIHGKEPQSAAPLFKAARVQVNFRLFTSLRRILDISYLGIEQPQANILVFADGTTNIPEPKEKKESDTTALDTVIDLAVDRFLISNGTLALNSARQPIDIRGNNLHALLRYNVAAQKYSGELSLQPIYVVAGRSTPVVFTVTLPVALERRRVALENARIATPESAIVISGSLEDLKNPATRARISGHVALADLQKLANLSLDLRGRSLPSVVDVDGNAVVAKDRITVNDLKLTAGKSHIQAAGTLKGPQGDGWLAFQATLALDELGRLAKLEARPDGVVVASGRATLAADNRYQINGEIEGRNLSFAQGTQRFRDINLRTGVNFDSQRLDLKGLRLSALRGQFNGNASLEDFARYSISGSLRDFNLQTAMASMGEKPLPYDGSISGPVDAHGDLKARGTKLAAAGAKLVIAPGRRGIPVSGRITAEYSGESGNINVTDSYIALPNTRFNFAGSLNQRLNVELTSRNLDDLLAAAGPNPPAIKLESGQAHFGGYVTGGLTAPHVYGHLAVTQFSAESRRFDSLDLDLDAAGTRAAVSNGVLQRGPMQAQFAIAAGLDHWSPKPNQPLQATAGIRNGDLADVMALAGQSPAGYSGVITADAKIGGTLGNPTGAAEFLALNGTILDEPFDRIQARVNLADQWITIPSASLNMGNSQVNLSAEFQHPRESLSIGRLHAHVRSNPVNLDRIRTLQQERPNTAGVLTIDADVRGSLSQTKIQGKDETEFLLTAINADASVRGLRLDGQSYGDATLKAATSGSAVRYDLISNFAGSDVRINGNTQLVKDYPTTADATLRNLPVERVLAAAKEDDIPAKGVLSGTAHVSGTLENPQANVDLELSKAVVYDEPLDRVHARATYLPQQIDVPLVEIAAGPSRLELTAHYDHPAHDLNSGDLQFKVNSSRLDLVRIRNVQKARPGLGGTLQVAAAGNGKMRSGTPQILFRDLNTDISASGISAQGKRFGDLTFKASTNAGRLNFTLDSDLASASIHGRGNAQLSGSYPIDAQLNFSNLAWSRIEPLLTATSSPGTFEATAEGQVNINGPVLKSDELRGALRIANLQFSSLPRTGSSVRGVTIRNQGPIAATLDRGVVHIDSAHLTGPQTDINATGTIGLLQAQPVSLNLKANTDIGLLQDFDRDVFASGKVALDASVGGSLAKPLVNGTLRLQNASINYVDVPNGLSNANGQIVFNGNSATIRSLSAESGGGKVALSGFVSYSDMLRLGLRATATNVRVRSERGVSIVASASLSVTGTMQASLASGSVTINRVTYAPQSDFGSILSRAAPPVQAAASSDSLLDHMRLDVRVRTSSATAVRAAIAENLQMDADLRVRGTAARPGVLGRVVVTRGDLVFFGSKYQVNSGTIGFYDPLRIEPILDLSLETQAKGVNVVLNVTGPIDNMKLSYTSEPPLQFQEIVSLLASGTTPTSDPTLLANQPSQPQQNFQQMGESAIVGKALADPLANRLQRVFGISQLKIDPAFTSGSDLPQARVTLQQQVATNLTFTYVTALEDPNSQIIRIEWAFAPTWSAIANRDGNGIFSINLIYKKQFR